MFQRLALDHSALFFGALAFITSASIYVAFFWRAMRMKSKQVEHFENLPFVTETRSERHDA